MLRRGGALLWIGLSALCGMTVAAQAGDGSWYAAAAQALMPALHAAYPDVTEWAIHPLLRQSQEQALQAISLQAAKVTVTHVGKRSSVRLAWPSGERRLARTIWFAVEGRQSVATARSTLRAGSALAPQDSLLAEQDVLLPNCSPITELERLAGMRAKRKLQVGDVICSEFIEPRPAVSRGEQVLVHSVAGAVTITTKAVAQQDGALGQRLRVKNPVSGDVYLASVTGQAEVVVHE